MYTRKTVFIEREGRCEMGHGLLSRPQDPIKCLEAPLAAAEFV
jgi:hypothetical protein